MEGTEYLKIMVSTAYANHQTIRFKNDCGFGCGRAFMARFPYMEFDRKEGKRKQNWILLESEIRRPDISLRAVRLLLGCGGGPKNVEETKRLLGIIAVKEQAAVLLKPFAKETEHLRQGADEVTQGDLQLSVSTLSGNVVAQVSLPPSASVLDVKHSVTGQCGISEDRQELLWLDVKLEDAA